MLASIVTTTRKCVTVAPGVEIYTERRTLSTTIDPTETILFIHGLGCSINTFYPIFSHILSARPQSTLLAFDWSGCGLSPYPGLSRPTVTVRDLVNDLDKLVELEAPRGSLVVIADNTGGILAIRWLTSPAVRSPHIVRVESAILIGGPTVIPQPPLVAQMLCHLTDIVSVGKSYELEEYLLPKLLRNSTRERCPLAVALMRSVLVGHSKEGLAAAIRAISRTGDEGPLLWERIPKGMRVLFIGGEDDLFIKPSELRWTASKVFGSQVAIFDWGRTPTVEDPELIAKVINEFLRSWCQGL